jgi:type IV secretion system protein TrbL
MPTDFITRFLDQFIRIIDTGFGLIEGDVGFVLNALIVISVTLAGVQWALSAEAPMAPFFRKVLFVGLFAFLIHNWSALAGALNQSGALLGLRAGGGGLALAELHNPARVAGVGVELFGRTAALAKGLNILTDFLPLSTILLAAVLVMLGFFILALQLFSALLAFKLGSLVAFVALPWGVFSGTAWVAERPLGWVVGSAVRLFVLALIASVSISFVAGLPAAFTLDAGGVLNVLLFGLTMLALSWFGPQLASEVVAGQPQLSGADGVRAAQGAAVTGVAAGAGAALAVKTGMRLAGGMAGGVRSIATHLSGAGKGGAGRAIDHSRMQPKPPSGSRGRS